LSYRLFLDDVRNPEECRRYMAERAGDLFVEYWCEWIVVRSYAEFVDLISQKGLPMLISFDHDLDPGGSAPDTAEGYDAMGTKNTGWHCSYWLMEYLRKTGQKRPLCIVHSVNKAGTKHINRLLGIQ